MIRENIPKIRDVAYCFSKVSACLAGLQSSCPMRIAGGSSPRACVCASVFACARGRGGHGHGQSGAALKIDYQPPPPHACPSWHRRRSATWRGSSTPKGRSM
eukprot:COSAG01_NODE_30055_length_624_cov_0.563810_2_plen_101_part_01